MDDGDVTNPIVYFTPIFETTRLGVPLRQVLNCKYSSIYGAICTPSVYGTRLHAHSLARSVHLYLIVAFGKVAHSTQGVLFALHVGSRFHVHLAPPGVEDPLIKHPPTCGLFLQSPRGTIRNDTNTACQQGMVGGVGRLGMLP